MFVFRVLRLAGERYFYGHVDSACWCCTLVAGVARYPLCSSSQIVFQLGTLGTCNFRHHPLLFTHVLWYGKPCKTFHRGNTGEWDQW